MSLTSHLDDKQGPVRGWFDARLPNLRPFYARCRAHGRPSILPPLSEERGGLGTALDYRLRYFFVVEDPQTLTAARGLRWVGDVDPVTMWDGFADHVRGVIDRIAPVGCRLGPAHERELAQICWVLGQYEACYRMGPGRPSPLDQLREGCTVAGMLALASDAAVDDVVALMDAAYGTPLCVRRWSTVTPDPIFAGSVALGGADGDLVIDGCLIEIKTTTRDVPKNLDVMQLLGYALLDYDDAHQLGSLGFYLSRVPALVEWPIADAFNTAAGQPVKLAELRREFRDVVDVAADRTARLR